MHHTDRQKEWKEGECRVSVTQVVIEKNMIPLIRIAIVQPCRRWIGEIKKPRNPVSSTMPAVALIQAIAQTIVSVGYFEKSTGAANASRGSCARRAVANAIASVPVIPSAPAISAHTHARFDSEGARRSRRRASAVLRGQPCPLRYHQKEQSHPAVTTSIQGIRRHSHIQDHCNAWRDRANGNDQ